MNSIVLVKKEHIIFIFRHLFIFDYLKKNSHGSVTPKPLAIKRAMTIQFQYRSKLFYTKFNQGMDCISYKSASFITCFQFFLREKVCNYNHNFSYISNTKSDPFSYTKFPSHHSIASVKLQSIKNKKIK